MTNLLGMTALLLATHMVSANPLTPQILVSNQQSPLAKTVTEAAMSYANFWNTGDAKFARKALLEDFQDMTPPEGREAGIAGVLAASSQFRQAVPNLHVEVEHLLVSDNYATIRYRFKGNFTGKMGEKQGAGQVVDFPAVDIYEVHQGKITKNWHLEDYYTFFSQIH